MYSQNNERQDSESQDSQPLESEIATYNKDGFKTGGSTGSQEIPQQPKWSQIDWNLSKYYHLSVTLLSKILFILNIVICINFFGYNKQQSYFTFSIIILSLSHIACAIGFHNKHHAPFDSKVPIVHCLLIPPVRSLLVYLTSVDNLMSTKWMAEKFNIVNNDIIRSRSERPQFLGISNIDQDKNIETKMKWYQIAKIRLWGYNMEYIFGIFPFFILELVFIVNESVSVKREAEEAEYDLGLVLISCLSCFLLMCIQLLIVTPANDKHRPGQFWFYSFSFTEDQVLMVLYLIIILRKYVNVIFYIFLY